MNVSNLCLQIIRETKRREEKKHRQTSQLIKGQFNMTCNLTKHIYLYFQDSELLRRKALERRLESEEAKKQEKTKKKKKMAF